MGFEIPAELARPWGRCLRLLAAEQQRLGRVLCRQKQFGAILATSREIIGPRAPSRLNSPKGKAKSAVAPDARRSRKMNFSGAHLEDRLRVRQEALCHRFQHATNLFPRLAGRSVSRFLLESVRRLQAGLHSFLSMRRIEARRKNASAFRLRVSQSLASLRQRLSHAIVRSTIQRFGKTTNPLT